MINFQATLNTDGTGYWSDATKAVNVTGFVVDVYPADDEDDEAFGELRVYFDTATWDVYKDGLIYTDLRFLKELEQALQAQGYDTSDMSYSEQGMQGSDYVSLDIGAKFIASVGVMTA